MNASVESINQLALEEMNVRAFYRAQVLFRENATKNPCFITLNNLGVFYAYEGINKPDCSRRSAEKLGIRYLKKAETYQRSHLTYSALGDIYFKNRDYEEAGMSFRQACELVSDYKTLYNYAISLYELRAYKEAMNWFEKALHNCDISNFAEMYASYLYTLLHSDRDLCCEKLPCLLKDDTNMMESDKFIISYLCDELLTAESLIKPMLKRFHLGGDTIAMIFSCLFRLHKDAEAAELLKLVTRKLEGYEYNVKLEIKQINKIYSDVSYRNKMIASFRYAGSLLPQCFYYGCHLHNN